MNGTLRTGTAQSLTAAKSAIHHERTANPRSGRIDLEVGAIKREVMDWCGARCGLVADEVHGWRWESSPSDDWSTRISCLLHNPTCRTLKGWMLYGRLWGCKYFIIQRKICHSLKHPSTKVAFYCTLSVLNSEAETNGPNLSLKLYKLLFIDSTTHYDLPDQSWKVITYKQNLWLYCLHPVVQVH